MKDKIVTEIWDLCQQHRYDEAIEKTNELKSVNNTVAIKAHFLVMEHEANYLRSQQSAN